MSRNYLEHCVEINSDFSQLNETSSYVSLEAEIPEVLYQGMKDFLGSNPEWDQYRLLSSALANFLFQNGCVDRAVTECYLNDLFTRLEV